MAVTCTTENLMELSKCFRSLTELQLEAIKTYLLAVQAGGSTDPSVLADLAKCFMSLSEDQKAAIQTYLLCQIANGGGGACANLEGADSPLGSVTPDFIGQVYQQSDGTIWQAASLLSSSWVIINGTDLFTYNSSTGTEFSSTLLREFTGDFWITGAGSGSALTGVSFPNLTTVGGFFDLDDHPDFATLDLSSLETVGDGSFGLFLSQLGQITDITLPSVVTNSGSLIIQGNTALTSLNLPSLVTVTGEFLADNNTSLVTVDVSSYLPTNGENVGFSGNAMDEASVDLLLARCVANAAYVTGNVDLAGGTNAPPGVQGAADVITLTGRGVTVTTN